MCATCFFTCNLVPFARDTGGAGDPYVPAKGVGYRAPPACTFFNAYCTSSAEAEEWYGLALRLTAGTLSLPATEARRGPGKGVSCSCSRRSSWHHAVSTCSVLALLISSGPLAQQLSAPVASEQHKCSGRPFEPPCYSPCCTRGVKGFFKKVAPSFPSDSAHRTVSLFWVRYPLPTSPLFSSSCGPHFADCNVDSFGSSRLGVPEWEAPYASHYIG